MNYDKFRKISLRISTLFVLYLTVIPIIFISSAASYVKIGDIEGTSKYKVEEWTSAEIKGDKLLLRNKKGAMQIADQGIFTLKNGEKIEVKAGKIIRRTKRIK